MKSTMKLLLIVTGIGVLVAVSLAAGVLLSRSAYGLPGYGPGMMGNGGAYAGTAPFPAGMMSGVIGPYGAYSATVPSGPYWTNGMMTGGMGGMMGNYGTDALRGVKPVTVDQAESTVRTYLAGLNNPDLALDEVLAFHSNAYARIVEKSTGVGAFEVLVEPETLAVVPEPGPNMMWNTKYGMMTGGGMMGLIGNGRVNPNVSAAMPISAEQAIQSAQQVLDRYIPGAKAATNADAFYGYYTIEITRDGQTVGMLSVNGVSNQVWVHTWHGDFIRAKDAK